MKNEQIATDKSVPAWFRILNIEDNQFEKSKYAAPLGDAQEGKFRLKDIKTLEKVVPEVFEKAAEDVKQFNKSAQPHSGTWKKIASIPQEVISLKPEIAHDKKALDQFLSEYPAFRVENK